MFQTLGLDRRAWRARRTLLFQPGQPCIEIGKSLTEQFAVPGICHGFQLLHHLSTRKPKSLSLTPGSGFSRAHLRAERTGLVAGFRLLRFDGFALPTSGHPTIIVPGACGIGSIGSVDGPAALPQLERARLVPSESQTE